MTERNDGGPAFPGSAGQPTWAQGMTLRDYFAGLWVAAGHHANLDDNEAARQAYSFADAMIEARKETT